MILVDKFNRPVDLMQVAASASCQYDCSHCTLTRSTFGNLRLFPTDHILSFVNMMVNLGLKRVRLAGGEPLLRPDIIKLASELSAIKKIESVSLSTNGLLLESMAEQLCGTGLKRLFVLLPTLDRNVFKSITGSDDLEKILRGLDAMMNYGCMPITIKTPILQGVNDNEIESIVDWVVSHGLNIYLTQGVSRDNGGSITQQSIISRLQDKYELTRLKGSAIFNDPWKLNGTQTKVKVITSGNERECSTCNRLWLSADGVISLCSGMSSMIDLNPIFESEDVMAELESVAVRIVLNKPINVKKCGTAPLTYPEFTKQPGK